MEYTLMHKSVFVLDIDLDEATSSVRKILTAYHPEHLPFGTASKRGGDRAREGHDLGCCRTQFKLVADMEERWSELAAFAGQYLT